MENQLAKKLAMLSADYLVIERKATPERTFELRWDKVYGFWDVVTLTEDGVWLSTISCKSQHEARAEFDRVSR